MLSSLLVQSVDAQDESVKHPNNKISLNGKEYYMHIVRKGETLSAISRAYEIPVDTIIADNPQLTYQIYPDQYIKVRIKQEPKQADSYNYHLKACPPFLSVGVEHTTLIVGKDDANRRFVKVGRWDWKEGEELDDWRFGE